MKRAVEISNSLVYPPGAAVYRSEFMKKEVTQMMMYAFIANLSSGEILFRRYGDLNWQQLNFTQFEGKTQPTITAVFDDWQD